MPHLAVGRTSSAVSTPAASPDNSSPAASVAAAAAAASAPPPQPVFKILPRASRETSSASSSADVDDDGSSSFSTGTRSKLRRDLTLEEREAAYKEARERIFSRPDPVERNTTTAPSTSAASSNAGEDAASVQSLGYGITRPSSAGSTFSRSSAALSVSGQRPPPSIASDSNSSMRSGYFGYYQHQGPPPPAPSAPPAGSGGIPYPMPNLRQAAPIFDPATGGWTYHASSADFAQTPSYSMPYGGQSQQPPPTMPMPMPYPASTSTSQQFDASGSAVTPSAWHRNLPSPALSGSSEISFSPSHHHQQPQHHHHVPPPTASPQNSIGSNNADPGYLMRFPEGAIVTAGGGVVGPPQPYAAVAVGAGLRSASTLSLGASSSASRVATRGGTSSGPNSLRRLSQSTTQSLGSVHSSSAPPSDDAASRRSPSATSGAADDSPEASLVGENLSEVGSSAGDGSGPSSLAGAAAQSGGSSDGKRHGRKATIVSRSGRLERARERADDAEDEGQHAESSREPSPLHPSLPAKPTWVAGTAPTVPSGSSAAGPPSASDPSGGHAAAKVPLRDPSPGGHGLASLTSSSASSPSSARAPGFPPLCGSTGGPIPPPPPAPAQGAWNRTAGLHGGVAAGPLSTAVPPPTNTQANGYTHYIAPSLASAPHPYQQQPLQQHQHQQQQQPHLQPSSYAAWLSQAAVPAPPAHSGYQTAPRHPNQPPSSMYASPGPLGVGQPADLMTMPDMRRPPPRSTQLFDPNKPNSTGAVRRVASGAGSARRM